MADEPNDPDADDMGTTFLKKHMSEGQTSRDPGSLGDKTRNTAAPGTDSYYNNRYGKGGDADMDEHTQPTTVNREDKTSKRGGDIGTDAFYAGKYGGDGITGGRKPKKSQLNKTLKY